jgi:hypothetical protein
MQDACSIVKTTSGTANKILVDVKSAATNMNSRAATSMNEFSEFLDGTGQKLNSDIVSHFDELDIHLQDQSEIVNDMTSSVVTYGNTILTTKVEKIGTTFIKQTFPDLPLLASTRSHDSIKSEIRQNSNISLPLSSILARQPSFSGTSYSDLSEPTADSNSEIVKSNPSAEILEEQDDDSTNQENINPITLNTRGRKAKDEVVKDQPSKSRKGSQKYVSKKRNGSDGSKSVASIESDNQSIGSLGSSGSLNGIRSRVVV